MRKIAKYGCDGCRITFYMDYTTYMPDGYGAPHNIKFCPTCGVPFDSAPRETWIVDYNAGGGRSGWWYDGILEQ